ncbi:MAG: hypothetical protein FH748_07780 [Balneolaceae bacterium]|nr:hypothetical protein [Balneolaceae bacterium]
MFNKHSSIWQWAIFCFILAGITGFLYRLGFIGLLPDQLNLVNMRHAHSHLMFFGWASLLPLYLIKHNIVPGYSSLFHDRMMRISFWVILIFGLVSFPAFLRWGYQPVQLGDSLIPISAIFSGMVMIGWYLFMTGYLIYRYKAPDFKPSIWFEGALTMLFISSLGAWGIAFTGVIGFGGPLFGKALTHFFLSTFTEGWVVIMLLGILARGLNMEEEDFVISPTVMVGLIAFGAPLTFPYGLSESLVSIPLSVSARVGGFLISQSILLFVYSVIQSGKASKTLWLWPLFYLLVKGIMQLTASITSPEIWVWAHGIRVLYLHVLLLGALTTTMILYLNEYVRIERIYIHLVIGSVFLVILSLVLLSRLWPAPLSCPWVYNVVAIVAILPVVSITALWIKVLRTKEKHKDEVFPPGKVAGISE